MRREKLPVKRYTIVESMRAVSPRDWLSATVRTVGARTKFTGFLQSDQRPDDHFVYRVAWPGCGRDVSDTWRVVGTGTLSLVVAEPGTLVSFVVMNASKRKRRFAGTILYMETI